MPDMNRLMKAATASSSSLRLVVMCGNIEVFNINMTVGDVVLVNESLLPLG